MTEPITPVLDDVELRAVQQIVTLERRTLVEHRVPGMAGSAFQDLGRTATRVRLSGVLFGADAQTDLEKLRQKFQAAEPVAFSANITTATDIVDVLIEDLQVIEQASRTGTYVYQIILRESPPPPPPPSPLDGLNTDILGDAQGLFDQALALGDVLGSLGNVPNFGDPTVPLGGMLDQVGETIGGLGDALGKLEGLFS